VYILPVIVALYVFATEKNGLKKVIYITVVILLCVEITNIIFKPLFSVIRPFVTLGYTPLGFEKTMSFPSTHATLVGALFISVYFSVSKHRWFTILVGVLCLGVAVSRIMLGLHYPSDVLAGLVWGSIAAYIGYRVVLYKHV
jgi:membrane-associated phospholipid phosphatase